MRMRRLLAAAVLASAAFATACGGGDSAAKDEISDLLQAFVDAYNTGTASDAYRLLDSGSRMACPAAAFSTLFDEAKAVLGRQELSLHQVTEVAVDGDRATALVSTAVGDLEPGEAEPGEFVKEGGQWRLVFESSICSQTVVSEPTPITSDLLAAELDDRPILPGVYYPPHPGLDGAPGTGDERSHVPDGGEIPICAPGELEADEIGGCYHSNPPTSGPHSRRPAPFAVLDEPVPKENLVHNMEHGGVVVWYNTDDEALIEQLAEIVSAQLDRGRLVVMTPYDGMDEETIALTSWTRLDGFPVSDFDARRVLDFIDTHQRRFNPEGF